MRHLLLTLGLALTLSLPLTGCGGEEPGSAGVVTQPPAEPAPAAPTKASVIGMLRGLLAAVEAGDVDRALGFLVMFPGMDPDKATEAVGKFVERREISAHGIDVLEAKGNFGTLAELFPDRADYLAKKAGVDPAQCFGLALDPAEVAVHWDGTTARFIRVDDVGKLE